MDQQSLFNAHEQRHMPLANRMRPTTLDEYVGQSHLVGDGAMLRQLIEQDRLPSMIFWGPPGVGKTTLARIVANKTKAAFIDFSAATNGIKEIKEVMERAKRNFAYGDKTILFIDEIHRFNKAQQDAFLPFVENGSIILIGATTENPSFEVNAALLSRCKVFVMQPLSVDDLAQLLRRAVCSYGDAWHTEIQIADDLVYAIATFANGDARTLLNTLDMIVNSCGLTDGATVITEQLVEQCINKKMLLYDKSGEEHYNLISALHKSMRNSDAQAAVYWLTRMLESGEDPLYIARRVTRFASEDIGMANSSALEVCVAAYQACHFIGMPECGVHLTHAVVYCALAPKSNALDVAYMEARADAQRTVAEPVPLVIRNAPTKLMSDLHYGEGYLYAHNYENKITNMQCLPDALKHRQYYRPTNQGLEAKVRQRMDEIERLRSQSQTEGV